MPVIEVESIEHAQEELQKVQGAIVVVPVYNAFDDCLACFESLLRHTNSNVAILVVDDAGGDTRALNHLKDAATVGERVVVILRHKTNSGFVGSCNDAFAATSSNDVILVNSDVVVGPQWYERLTDAAASSSLIATVSTLTNHGSILSVPDLNRATPQLPAHLTPDTAAEAVAKYALRIRPTISTAIGHCTYIRREALDAVGGFDTAFGRGYGEEVDFSQRAIRLGFKHVCADDVFTFHRGSGSFGSELSTKQQENEKIVVARYPWYEHWNQALRADAQSPLAVVLARASIALRGLTVAIDGRALGPTLMGTQQVIIETVRTLAMHHLVSKVVVYINGPIPTYAIDRLGESRAEFVQAPHGSDFNPPLCDVAYRPYQALSSDDVAFLRKIGRWTSINQLDNIAFSNPAYFASSREWMRYRDTARLCLSTVDGVAYLSGASMHEALSEGLVPAGTSQKVVYTGSQFDPIPNSEMPRELKGKSGPFLFVLGASYHHKNRPFAVRAVVEMRKRGWQGTLILAGPTPPAGSSLGLEAAEFLAEADLRKSVVQLPSLSESQKRWIFENASLMLYPTIVEGFGLVPFEAANYGLATLSTRQGSLNEILPTDIPSINNFDPSEFATQILTLLSDDAERARIVSRISETGKIYTAEATSDLLVEMFLDMTSRPPKRTAAIVGEDIHFSSWIPGLSPISVPINRVVPPGILVRIGWKFGKAKRMISPEGSLRQEAIRKFSNRIRRALKR
jgi:GT2 family glycosyltransferase